MINTELNPSVPNLAQVEQTYDCEVGAALFHSDEMMAFASGGIFSLHYPDHPLTQEFRQAAARLAA